MIFLCYRVVLNRLTRLKKKYLLPPFSCFCLQFSFEQVIIENSDSLTFLEIMRFSLGRKLIRISARCESSAPRVPSYYDKFAKPEPPGVFKLFPYIWNANIQIKRQFLQKNQVISALRQIKLLRRVSKAMLSFT